MDFLTLTIGKQKNIALIAHDSKKHEMIDWCEANKEILKGHFLCGTGTTARMITEATGLPVKGYNSGPLGGDQQIGAKIVEGRIDFVVFFSDPLTAQPHDPDVKALLRIAQVYDIPIANNRATADFLISSPSLTGRKNCKFLDHCSLQVCTSTRKAEKHSSRVFFCFSCHFISQHISPLLIASSSSFSRLSPYTFRPYPASKAAVFPIPSLFGLAIRKRGLHQ